MFSQKARRLTGGFLRYAADLPPGRMRCACIQFEMSLREYFGESFINSYCTMKTAEWNAYTRHLTEWERQTTLDC